ncbi:MAG TPA: hypothetical protein VEN82_08705 [Actinomycetota bacterium]|nr:hypothetical protein [Actinomycetota bacterium]
MPRRTIHLSQRVDELIRRMARPGESFSATVARLVEDGAVAAERRPRMAWIGAGEGAEDLGQNAERYLAEIARERRS